jgi:hypothetical protein
VKVLAKKQQYNSGKTLRWDSIGLEALLAK